MSRAVRTRAASIIQEYRVEKLEEGTAATGKTSNNGNRDQSATKTAATSARPLRAESAAAPSSPTTGEQQQQQQSGASRCLVYCRLRPGNKKDYEEGGTQLISVHSKTVTVKNEKDYNFDGTFDHACKQEDIFANVAVPCLQHAFKGFCSALMCYGQTGTGKSFTMCCTKEGVEGIIPRSAKYIFDSAARDPARAYTITAQFVQIYRDSFGDLMTESGKEKVDIRYDVGDGVSLPGCTTKELLSAQEFMEFYHEGDARRVVMATAMNPESSRGHTALVINVSSLPADDPCGSTIRGKITFIDLAGYERFSKTGISNANPIMKDEARTINASLLSLGHVVTALSNRDKHTPWRNSKLTRLLQDSIGGRSRTSIILTVGPSSDHLHETTNSLQFGMRAMAVKVEAKMSVSVDYEKLAAKLQAMLSEKDEKINMLEVQVASRDLERSDLLERQRRDIERMKLEHDQSIAELQAHGASAEVILRLGQQHEVELENQQDQHQEELQYQEESNSREMLELISEESKKERLRESDVKLAQERLIAEFEKKLADARQGTNSDLVKAVHDLALRDAALVQRAAQIAQLQEQVDLLREQVVELGGKPVAGDDDDDGIEATFLDILQVEEIQERMKGEIDAEHAMLLEARAQLDKVTQESKKRNTELQIQVDRVSFLEEELVKQGVSVHAAERELTQAKEAMVDPLEFENMKVELGSEIEALQKKNDALEHRVSDLKQQLQEQQALTSNNSIGNDSLSATTRSTTSTSAAANAAGGAGGGMMRRATMSRRATMARRGSDKGAQSDEKTPLLQAQLDGARSCVDQVRKENSLLKERITALEVRLAQGGQPDAAAQAAPKDGEDDASAALSPFGVLDEESIFERLRHVEFDAAMELNTKLNDKVHHMRRNERVLEEYASKLKQTLLQVGLDAPPLQATAVSDGPEFSMAEYMKVVRAVRDQCTHVQMALLMRSAVIRSQALQLLNLQQADGGGASSEVDVPDLDDEVLSLLTEKDAEMHLKDEMILQSEGVSHYLRRIVIRLEDQLLSHTIPPEVALPHDTRQAVKEAEAQDKEKDDAQREEMQKRLESTEMEQARVNKMLESLAAERAKETSTFTNYKTELEDELQKTREKAHELEDQQRKQREELTAVEEQKQHEKAAYEDILQQNVREMMKMQAEKCQEENRSVIDVLKMKWRRRGKK